MKTKKENKTKTGKLIKISDENHLALKVIAAKRGEKIETLANEAVDALIRREK